MLLGIPTVGICMYFAPPAAASAAACAPPPAPIPAPSASLGPAAALASATVHEKSAEYPQSILMVSAECQVDLRAALHQNLPVSLHIGMVWPKDPYQKHCILQGIPRNSYLFHFILER